MACESSYNEWMRTCTNRRNLPCSSRVCDSSLERSEEAKLANIGMEIENLVFFPVDNTRRDPLDPMLSVLLKRLYKSTKEYVNKSDPLPMSWTKLCDRLKGYDKAPTVSSPSGPQEDEKSSPQTKAPERPARPSKLDYLSFDQGVPWHGTLAFNPTTSNRRHELARYALRFESSTSLALSSTLTMKISAITSSSGPNGPSIACEGSYGTVEWKRFGPPGRS